MDPYWEELNRETIDRAESNDLTLLKANLLRETLATLKFYVLLPKGDSYENVFARPLSTKAESEMDSATLSFSSLSPEVVRVLHSFPRADLIENIGHISLEPVVIVAHSEYGRESRVIKLSDGTTIDVAELHRICVANGSPCIVVTCHGKDVGIDRKITITEAYNMRKRAFDAIQSGQATTAEDIVAVMRLEANAWRQSGVTITVLANLGGEAVVVVCSYKIEDDWPRYIFIAVGAGATVLVVFVFYRRIRPRLGPSA